MLLILMSIRAIFVALMGFFLFSEVPDAWTWVGSLVIFAPEYTSPTEKFQRVKKLGKKKNARHCRPKQEMAEASGPWDAALLDVRDSKNPIGMMAIGVRPENIFPLIRANPVDARPGSFRRYRS